MFQETYQITFTDGRVQTVTSTQRDLAQVDVVAGRRGIHPPAGQLFMIAYPWLTVRMRAWMAYRREESVDLDWERFDEQVDEVIAVAGDPDPTQSGTSDESSSESPPEQD